MDRPVRILLVLLIIILVLNLSLLSRVKNIENMINGRLMIDSELQNLMSLTQQNSDRINQAMATIETERRWITPVEFAGVKQEGGSIVVRLAWIIKDYPGGAQVIFNYRKPGDKEFTSQQAAPAGDGRFEVELRDDLKSEPLWKMQTIYTTSDSRDNKASRVIETAKTVEGQQNIEYYISIKDGTNLKSSEIAGLDMERLSWSMYAPLSAEVQVNQTNKRYWIFLTQSVNDPKQAKLSQAFLEAYQDDKLVNQTKLSADERKSDSTMTIFTTEWYYKDLSFDRVYLTVEYSDGKKFKKEITGK
ncbi:MAG: hypothetical protein RO469_05785 [Thermincola sp.]|nr:hypothetical protein [Thermincola sp.]